MAVYFLKIFNLLTEWLNWALLIFSSDFKINTSWPDDIHITSSQIFYVTNFMYFEEFYKFFLSFNHLILFSQFQLNFDDFLNPRYNSLDNSMNSWISNTFRIPIKFSKLKFCNSKPSNIFSMQKNFWLKIRWFLQMH